MITFDKLSRNSLILFILSMVGNVANYFFQFYMARNLSTEDYGILNSLMSLMMILTVPTGVILMVLAKYSSHFKALKDMAQVRALFLNSLKKVLLYSSLGLVLYLLFSRYLGSFLKVPSLLPIIILGFIIFFSLLLPVNLGILQGLQKFWSFGIGCGLGGAFRLMFGIFLVALGLRVNGALAAIALSSFVLTIFTFIPLRLLFSPKLAPAAYNPPKHNPGIKENNNALIAYSLPVMLALFSFMVLVSLDLILVKHYFSAEEAGIYSSAAVLGRALFFLPTAIVMALFPMVSEHHTLQQDSYHLLRKGLILTLLLSGFGALLYLSAPGLVISILFGAKFKIAAPLLRLFPLAMLPLALINLLINFNLARKKTKFLVPLLLGCICQLFLMSIYHQTLYQILYILISVNLTIFLSVIIMLIFETKQYEVCLQ